MIYEINAITKQNSQPKAIEFLGEKTNRREAFKLANQNKKELKNGYIEVKLYNKAGELFKAWQFEKNKTVIEINYDRRFTWL